MLLICLILLALFCFNTNVTHSSSQYCRQIMQVETVHDFVAFFAYVMFVYIVILKLTGLNFERSAVKSCLVNSSYLLFTK